VFSGYPEYGEDCRPLVVSRPRAKIFSVQTDRGRQITFNFLIKLPK